MSNPAALRDEDVTEALVAFVNAEIMAAGRDIGPDDDLERAGVDSLALLQVLLFVERRYGFWIPDEDLTDEVTRTARSLARYVAARGA